MHKLFTEKMLETKGEINKLENPLYKFKIGWD